MRGVSNQSPARGRRASSAPFRLILGLVLLHGCGHAASDEANSGLEETDVAERVADRMEGIGKVVAGDVRIVVVDCDGKVEEVCGESKALVADIGKSTKPAGEGAGDAVDEAAEIAANVGECSGKRFKKCR